jgi:hypothetical protein
MLEQLDLYTFLYGLQAMHTLSESTPKVLFSFLFCMQTLKVLACNAETQERLDILVISSPQRFRFCYSGLFVDRRTQDAHPNSHVTLPVSAMRQGVLAAVVTSGAPANSHRRATVPLSAVRPCIRRPVEPPRAPANTRRCEAIPLPPVLEGVLAGISAGQAPRRKLRRRAWTVSRRPDVWLVVSARRQRRRRHEMT